MEETITIKQDGTYMGENPATMEDSETVAEMLEVVADEIKEA